ncbi:hypothetical protein PQX77_020848 [Marasmius sp. AFHP31]|nr:hypothetical protein PQX77_020848 [Marasmius sp. AFHP31]
MQDQPPRELAEPIPRPSSAHRPFTKPPPQRRNDPPFPKSSEHLEAYVQSVESVSNLYTEAAVSHAKQQAQHDQLEKKRIAKELKEWEEKETERKTRLACWQPHESTSRTPLPPSTPQRAITHQIGSSSSPKPTERSRKPSDGKTDLTALISTIDGVLAASAQREEAIQRAFLAVAESLDKRSESTVTMLRSSCSDDALERLSQDFQDSMREAFREQHNPLEPGGIAAGNSKGQGSNGHMRQKNGGAIGRRRVT